MKMKVKEAKHGGKQQPRLLIEKALEHAKLSAATALMQHHIGIESAVALQAVVALEQAKEVIWMRSALTMCEALRQGVDVEHEICFIPMEQQHHWFVFERPLHTPAGETAGLFVSYRSDIPSFVEASKRVVQLVGRRGVEHTPAFKRLLAEGNAIRPTELQWKISAIDPEGRSLFQFLLVQTPQGESGWSFEATRRCPFGECRVEDAHIRACPRCTQTVGFWLSWTSIAYRMLQGEFAETPEETQPEYITQTATRLEPAAKSWEKPEVRRVQHTMQVIRFDACVRPRQAMTHRGSWIAGRRSVSEDEAMEADPGAILYLKIDQAGHTRTFRSDRYKAARGQSRHFQATTTRRPVTVAYLLRKRAGAKSLTQIIASKYQQGATSR